MSSMGGVVAVVDGRVFGCGEDEAAAFVLDHFLVKGLEGLAELDGEYAFVLFESLSNRVVFGRDTFGFRPLYYSKDEEGVIVGSRVRDVLREAGRPVRLRGQALDSFFAEPSVTFCGAETIFVDLQRARPNHTEVIEIGSGHHSSVACWRPPAAIDRRRTVADVTRELPEILKRSLQKRRVDDAVLLLSGGMDSAAVAVALRCLDEHGPGTRNISTLTIIDSITQHPDGPRAVSVAEHLGLPWRSLDAAQLDPLRVLRHLAEVCEFPTKLPGLLFLESADLAARIGARTLITGEGADVFWDILDPFTQHSDAYWRARDSVQATARAGVRKLMRAAGRALSLTVDNDISDQVSSERRCTDCTRVRERMASRLWRRQAAALEKLYGGSYFENHAPILDRRGLRATHPFLDREMAAYAFTTPPEITRFGDRRKGLIRHVFGSLLPSGYGESWTPAHWGKPLSRAVAGLAASLALDVDPRAVIDLDSSRAQWRNELLSKVMKLAWYRYSWLTGGTDA